MDADTDCIGVHVTFSDHEHGVDFHLFGALDFAVDLVAAFVEFCANLISAQFLQNRARVINQLGLVADSEDADLFRR